MLYYTGGLSAAEICTSDIRRIVDDDSMASLSRGCQIDFTDVNVGEVPRECGYRLLVVFLENNV